MTVGIAFGFILGVVIGKALGVALEPWHRARRLRKFNAAMRAADQRHELEYQKELEFWRSQGRPW